VVEGRELLERARAGLIGRAATRIGPFGERRLTYADYTASGRSVDLVEDAVREHVLGWYANTHTEASTTGRHTSSVREQARALVRRGVGGDDETAVIFCGSGTTGALDKLITVLGLRAPREGIALRLGAESWSGTPPEHRPVVFVGPYEHHSNEVAWRESLADVVVVPLDRAGGISLEALDALLHQHASRPIRIGSFSAASNVTGVLSDTSRISALLHAHGALACWDYAAAAPYVDIAMAARPGRDPLDYKDAVVLSPHKFVGGPGSPGVLAVRRDVLRNPVPSVPGGGTVSYVHPWGRSYLDDVEHREEGGTPDIVGSVRAGLAFALKQAIGLDLITALEDRHRLEGLAAWGSHPNLELLGPVTAARLPIFSFRVRTPDGGLLHHNLVVALLDDLFGIQARGGCSCAGPYGHRLLDIGAGAASALERQARLGRFGLKPGWARVSLPYVLGEAEVEYVLQAVLLVAQHGWKLLSQYRFDPETGIWRHVEAPADDTLGVERWLLDQPLDGSGRGQAGGPSEAELERILAAQLDQATRILEHLPTPPARQDARVGAEFDRLRWFELPAACLAG